MPLPSFSVRIKSFGRGVGVDWFVSRPDEALEDDGRADDGRAISASYYLPSLFLKSYFRFQCKQPAHNHGVKNRENVHVLNVYDSSNLTEILHNLNRPFSFTKQALSL